MFKSCIYQIFILIIVSCLQGTVLTCFDEFYQENSVKLAEIMPTMKLRVDQPRKHELRNFVHHLEPNIVLVNMTGVLTLRLDCWAPYPIDMKFAGHLTNQETSIKMFRKEFGSHSCFIINATMESYEEINGNYSCMAVDNPQQFSSYYIFVSPTPPGVLLTRGQQISIQIKPEDKLVTFPCAVSHPDVHVQLLKNGISPVRISAELSYDPKIGFRMKIEKNEDFKFGHYTCQTELSPNDHVNITLFPPKKFRVRPLVNHIRLLPTEQLSVACDSVEEFIITTTPPDIPFVKNEVSRMKGSSEETGNDENKDEPFYKFSGEFIAQYLPPDTTGLVTCKWKHSNRPFAEWSFRVIEKSDVKPGHLNTTKFKTECKSNIILFECNNVVECKINSCLRKDPKCQSNGHLCRNDKSCMQSGLVQCLTHSEELLSEIFFTGYSISSKNKTNRYVDWNHTSVDELLLLKQVLPYPNSRTENNIKFTCQGSSFVFSTGFKWYLVYKNNTRSALTTANGNLMNISVNNFWKEKKSNLESVLILPSTNDLEMIKDVTHVECSAPIWNSRKWISQRVSLNEKMLYFENAAVKSCKNQIWSVFGSVMLMIWTL